MRIVGFALLLAACRPALAPELVEDDRPNLVQDAPPRAPGNAFGFTLPANGNVVASPFTTRRTWAMLALDLDEGRRSAIAAATGLPKERIVDVLAGETSTMTAPGLELAAHGWFRGLPDDEVRNDMARGFGASVDEITSSEPINAWIARYTGITNLIPSVEPETTRVLVNTLTFHGAWMTPFDRRATTDAPFALGERTIMVPTMHATDRFAFARSRTASFVALPCNEGETALFFAVPTHGTLAALESELAGGLFERALASLTVEEGIVALPRFRLRTAERRNAQDVLPALADDTTLLFSSVSLEVDETGATAAVADAAETMPTAIPPLGPPRLRVFRADRPFLVWLLHAKTGRILVAGRVVDPR